LYYRADETPSVCALKAGHTTVQKILQEAENTFRKKEKKALMSHENIHLDGIL
jgi:hypothetical protein